MSNCKRYTDQELQQLLSVGIAELQRENAELQKDKVRLMYDLASRLQPLLQDCLDFGLDVPECGCAHSKVCSSCERHREAQRLAEQLVRAIQ